MDVITLEQLEENRKIPYGHFYFAFIINQVLCALRKEASWRWITIEGYSKLDSPGPHKAHHSRWSLNFSDNVREYDSVNLTRGKVQQLAKICGLEGMEAEWLVCAAYTQSGFIRTLGWHFFDNDDPIPRPEDDEMECPF